MLLTCPRATAGLPREMRQVLLPALAAGAIQTQGPPARPVQGGQGRGRAHTAVASLQGMA